MKLDTLPFKHCFAVIGCCLLSACGRADNQLSSDIQPVSVQLSGHVKARVSVGYHDADGSYYQKNDDTLGKLFDKDNRTWWTSSPDGCRVVVFNFVFDKPVFPKRIVLVHHGDTIPLIGGSSIGESDNENAPFVNGKDVTLERSKKQILDMNQSYYWHVFRAGEMTISTEGCNVKKGKLEIEEIEIEFSDKPTLNPEMSAAKLKSTLRSTAVWNAPFSWHFVDDEKAPDKEKYLAYLMYYGLGGDTEAEDIFKGYHPSGADLSEDQSALESWYDDTKQGEKDVRRKNR